MTDSDQDSGSPLRDDELGDWEVVEDESSSRTIVLSVRFNGREMRLLRDAAKDVGASLSDVVRDAVRVRFEDRRSFPVLLNATTENVSGVARAHVSTLGSGSDFGQFELEEESATAG